MWALMDVYLFPTAPLDSALMSLAIGVVLLIGLRPTCWQLPPRFDGTILRAVAERTFTYVAVFATVNFWRGVWYLWDEWSTDAPSALVSHVVGVAVLLGLTALRATLAPPSAFSADDDVAAG
eukprot:CAMPEP_0180694576 /NCGR_PEP_ID=MMETSP1038_2-20121128/1985_1 /TAXON_ID=632150 /ORGANISM="Azadinium spinosum, Strain 3D9" /LENGTH=121 /DNA_ID=CAMNT_0022725929 /DNA_START=84 /DNA_END=445 /DNA_ORIENTATION=+